mgnify:FL=1|tara:strand:+ start:497 stop:2170 length:1674 start_codon:yes stop_codon:yes gene_type:complete
MRKIFSVPLNPKLNPEQYKTYCKFLLEHKDYIKDIYFTSRIPPFMQDAMGDVFVYKEDYNYAIDQALNIQNTIGIPVSATFNNIKVPPTQKNLDIFIKHFKPLYDKGIRIATIPHTHWMGTGQIKKAFPDLYVKNTILRDVRTAAEIVNLAKRGFDYINLDRDLMRDRDTLLRIKTAKEWIKENLKKEIHISLLANEGCLGNCPMMVEHFEFNNSREGYAPQYFNDPISRVSCPKWDVDDPSVHLKTANIPPWKEDWDEFIDELGIDVFKMHGREAPSRLFETLDIIKRYAKNDEILIDNFNDYLEDNNLKEKPINAWRKKIKNCKFDCWECHYCDDIFRVKSEIEHTPLVKHVAQSLLDSGVPSVKNKVQGLTSTRVKSLMNSFASKIENYMEVGIGNGSIFCSVLENNKLNAVGIDNFELQMQPGRKDISTLPGSSFFTLEQNINQWRGDNQVEIINQDMFTVDTSRFKGKINMWFYDGPHDIESTKRAVEHYGKCFADECLLVFDDANWDGVVEGARQGINSINRLVSYEKILLNEQEDASAWWNGLYIVVLNV